MMHSSDLKHSLLSLLVRTFPPPPHPISPLPPADLKHLWCHEHVMFFVKRLLSYRGVVNDDITAGHIAMENVFFQVLDERALQEPTDKGRKR